MQQLSALKLRKLKPADKAYKMADGEGLLIYVATTGSKSWRFKYRFEGKEKGLTFGLYPDVTLASARQRCRTARQEITEGLDPSAERKRIKQECQGTNTAVAHEMLVRADGHGRGTTNVCRVAAVGNNSGVF